MTRQQADGGGLRSNAGKLRAELIPDEWEIALSEVLTAATEPPLEKYPPRNWERGMAWSIMVGCWKRHGWRYLRGERYDRETGCHHLAHVAWNVLALMSYDIRGIGTNDLPRAPVRRGRQILPTRRGKPFR